MGSTEKVRYEPPSEEFDVVKIEPLIDISLTDSTELWLIQCPKIQDSLLSDLDGQEITLKLHHDRHLGSFVGSSGKSYDMDKTPTLNPDASVFLSSSTGSKIVGKISRGVSLVHYPEPIDRQKDDTFELKKKAQRAAESLSTPSKIGSRSSGYKSSSKAHVSGLASGSKIPKPRIVGGGELKRDQSGGDSGKGGSRLKDEDLSRKVKRKKDNTDG